MGLVRVGLVAVMVVLWWGVARAGTGANRVVEVSLESAKAYADPFNEVTVDVEFAAPDGSVRRVPAFWAGGRTWRVRYASPVVGRHDWKAVCSDAGNASLHGVTGGVEVVRYEGENPLYRHGPVEVAPDRRSFRYADGTPFFWLADTWWMGLCARLPMEGFERLTRDRVEKGFNVVQIVAGLYPDMPPFDERGAGEAGFPWERDYSTIRPAYFDAADRRIARLVDAGLAPCIVGAWGYHLPELGVERMKRHWRYLVARWGAYPVVWCVAGEGAMPYYLSADKPKDAAFQREGWTEVARYVRSIDPFKRPVTIHPTDRSRTQVTDAGVLDFEMLQTGHGDWGSVDHTVRLLAVSRGDEPAMPVLNSEVCYEGILGTCPAEVVRYMTWTSLLAGTAGHTYGANGIWQVNTRERPYGKSPHGGNWGNTPWDEAMTLPGSGEAGIARRVLESLGHHRFEPHPEWAAYPAAGGTERPAWGEWIWAAVDADPAADAPAGKRYFRKTFVLPEGVKGGTLWLSVDDRYTAYVNGRRVASHGDWQAPRPVDVSEMLRAGRNVLAVEAENLPAPHPQNPAGLLCSLRAGGEAGGPVEFRSDGTWKGTDAAEAGWEGEAFDDTGWPAVRVIGAYPRGPWNELAMPRARPLSAAGVPGRVRVVFVPEGSSVVMKGIEPGATYAARAVDPTTGRVQSLVPVTVDGAIAKPAMASPDWVLVLERRP